MNFNSEATTKHSDEKKNRSPESFILPAAFGSSVFLAHEKQTDAQPAKTAKPAFVIDVVSNDGFPNVIRIKSAPERKMNTRKMPTIIRIVLRMLACLKRSEIS